MRKKMGVLWGRILLSLVSLGVIISSSASTPRKTQVKAHKQQLLVAAAMSLKDAMTQIGRAFEQANPDSKILCNFASSGQLRIQIENGAPVDLFAPASAIDMQRLFAAGLVEEKSSRVLAHNSLVLISNKSGQHINSLSDLTKPQIQRIALGNPTSVPAGKYAVEVFSYYKIGAPLKNKLIFGENVRQVLSYVARNEVDAGMVFATDARMEPNVRVVMAIPGAAHEPIIYPIALVKATKNRELAKKFIEFVISPTGKKILEQYGFTN